MKERTMSDSLREKIIHLIYQYENLDESNDDCTEDEFVVRVFRGMVYNMGFDAWGFYYTFFSISYPTLKSLVQFCDDNNLEMDISGSKNREQARLEIRMIDSNVPM